MACGAFVAATRARNGHSGALATVSTCLSSEPLLCHEPGDMGRSLGARQLAVVRFRALDVHRVEELSSCPFGPEHVKGRVLPVLRNDRVFALGL